MTTAIFVIANTTVYCNKNIATAAYFNIITIVSLNVISTLWHLFKTNIPKELHQY